MIQVNLYKLSETIQVGYKYNTSKVSKSQKSHADFETVKLSFCQDKNLWVEKTEDKHKKQFIHRNGCITKHMDEGRCCCESGDAGCGVWVR